MNLIKERNFLLILLLSDLLLSEESAYVLNYTETETNYPIEGKTYYYGINKNYYRYINDICFIAKNLCIIHAALVI